MENLRVLEGSEVFFRGLQHLYHQFKSGWRLRKYRSDSVLFLCGKSSWILCKNDYAEDFYGLHKLNPFVCHRRKPTTFRWWEEPCESLAINPDSQYTFV